MNADLSRLLFQKFGFQHDVGAWLRNIETGSGGAREPLAQKCREWTEEGGAEVLRTQLEYTYAGCGWAARGQSTFVLTESLAANLLLTEVDADDPKLPFDTFRIRSPGTRTPDILVHRFLRNSGDEALIVLFLDDDGMHQSASLGWPDSKSGLRALGASRDCLAETAVNLVFGLCSFLEARVEPLVLENHKAVERARVENRPAQRVFVVGRTVKIRAQLRAAVRNVREGKTTTAWKLDHKYVVRGHWKWQAVGHRPEVGPRPAKKIWVEPYWRGPEAAEAWRRTYEVST